MKAAIYDEAGGPEVIRHADVPDPICEDDGILIRVRAISIEGGDTINRATKAPPHPSYVVGYAAAGEIIEVGRDVRHLRVGDAVATFDMDGSHAALRAVPARRAWTMPDGLDFDRAAALPISFGTADHCLFASGQLAAGETVLIQAGAGGVGVAAIQLAHRAGARVLATVSGTDRAERLSRLGLDHAIDHRREDVAAAARRLTGQRGVDLVIDPVGSTLADSIAALRPHGRLVFVGNAGGPSLTVDLWPALLGNNRLTGVFMGAELDGEDVRRRVAGLLVEAARGGLDVIIDRKFPLSEAREAHRYVEEQRVVGRVLVNP